MRRGAYVGEQASRASGFPAIALQNETQAYFARFSTPPTATYKSALNEAIYRWKKVGVWALLQDLWLLCADTQADSLRNLITATRDATLVGAPTFTALKGFSNLSSANNVSLPFSTAGLTATGSGYALACKVAAPVTTFAIGSGTAAGGITGASGNTFVQMTNASVGANVGGSAPNPCPVLLGQINGTGIDPVHVQGTPGGGPATVGASPLVFNSPGVPNLMAYAVMPAPTTTQVRKFLGVLNTFLDDIGAL